jgi:glyoxalase family protein
MQLTTEGIHHATLVARDASATRRFYEDLLGVSLLERSQGTAGEGAENLLYSASRDADRGKPGTMLQVLALPSAPRGRWGVGGIHHVALGVSDAAAQLKWKRRLTDAGVDVTGPFDRRWFTSIYFTDPDGQILEIATAGPGYSADEPMSSLGSDVIIPPPQHLRGTRDDDAAAALTHPEPVPEISDDMILDGIHHISGITDALERSGSMYESGLGLRLVKKSVNQDDPDTPHWFWALYDGREVKPHSAMTLFGWRHRNRETVDGAGQTRSVGFRGNSLGDWAEHLRSGGIEVLGEDAGPFFRSLYFQAPDGMMLEITDGVR